MDDTTQIKSFLLYWIDYYKLQRCCFCNINAMIIKTISDECNITYTHYKIRPMHMIERRLNFVVT